ncbi:ribbon-helix-helix protein, CopG family [Candidatus Obscuribacterales bacterium]|nr:ribbon-helix-helix protein, CopG family [Candidatus Obscuribacterales bacterium]
MTKKILVGMPSNLLNLVDQTASAECRTRSDLVREALRRYIDDFHKKRLILNENALNIQRLENSYAGSAETGITVMDPVNGVSRF